VGAGPTGLVLALWLTRLGIRVRIVDKAAEAGTTSRALAVQARTLEFYRQIGLAEEVVERGRIVTDANFWVRGRKSAHMVFGELGKGISPYPFPLIFPQDQHEQLLVDRLADEGIQVERQVEFLSYREVESGIIALLRGPDGHESECEASYLAGCDGAHSAVRKALGIGFAGGTYAHMFYVADIDAEGEAANGELHVGLDKNEFLAVFPLKKPGRLRLVGTIKDDSKLEHESLAWEDVSRRVLNWMPIEVKNVNWFSSYRVHHRVAERFQKGRAFILGDAGHVHSPVGGQGMNTGIGDAVNLAWKLADVLRGRAAFSLVESYQAERIAFAQQLVVTTDQAFTGVISPSPIARFVRLHLIPLIVPIAIKLAAVRRLMFRTVSQANVNYRFSLVSQGRAGAIYGGDRLPWVPDNFAPLRSLTWQIHVYGQAPAWMSDLVPVHEFPWTQEARKAGLCQNALYLVRPDGYVAFADPEPTAAKLTAYLDSRKIHLAGSSGDRRSS